MLKIRLAFRGIDLSSAKSANNALALQKPTPLQLSSGKSCMNALRYVPRSQLFLDLDVTKHKSMEDVLFMNKRSSRVA